MGVVVDQVFLASYFIASFFVLLIGYLAISSLTVVLCGERKLLVAFTSFFLYWAMFSSWTLFTLGVTLT